MKAETITYKNSSKDYDDFQDGEHFLAAEQDRARHA